MDVKFWVGTHGQGRELSINGLVAVFKMLQGYSEQAQGMKYMTNPKTCHTVSLKHDTAVIAAVVKQIKMTEPE